MAGKKSTRRGGAHFFLVLFLAVVLLPLFHFDSPGAMVLAVLGFFIAVGLSLLLRYLMLGLAIAIVAKLFSGK